jgi:hypothetical protein
MNWEAIGAAAELLGALGVILTLFYLTTQIRLNTKAVNNQSLRDSQELITVSSLPLIEDENLAAIYVRGLKNFDDLTEVEKVRFHYLCTQRVHAAATVLALDQGADAYSSTQHWVERMMRSVGFRQWWRERGQHIVDPEFRKLADSLCRNIESEQQSQTEALGLEEIYQAPDAEARPASHQ